MPMNNVKRSIPLYLSVALSALVTIIGIPVMISASGFTEWSYIGAGQSVGSVIAGLVSFGWGVTGANTIATQGENERVRTYLDSVRVRLLVTPAAIALGFAVCLTITPNASIASSTAGLLSATVAGWSASFYYVGTGDLWRLFFLDSFPRILLTGMALIALAASDHALGAITVPLATTFGSVISLVAVSRSIRSQTGGLLAAPTPLREILRSGMPGLATNVSNSAVQVLPTLLVAWVAPAALPAFVFYDKLYKQVMTFASPLFTYLQGYVPRGLRDGSAHLRMRRAIQAAVITGILVLAGTATIGPLITDLLSAGEVDADRYASMLLGLLIAMSVADLVISRVGLVVKGKVSVLAWSSILGAVLGNSFIFGLTPNFGFPAALAGILLAVSVRAAIATTIFARTHW